MSFSPEQLAKLKELKKAGLTDQNVEAFSQVFELFDANGDGRISASELKSMIERCGKKCSDVEAANLIKKEDIDHNGSIELFEFIVLMKAKIDIESMQEGSHVNSELPSSTLGEVSVQNMFSLDVQDIP